ECKESEMKPSATDEETQRALWSLSEKFLNLDPSLASPSPPMKVLDINDTPLPPLPADATPETEESPSFPPKEEKTEEMILQEDPEPKATYSSPAFDDAPPAPSTQELSNVMGSLKELQKGVTHSDDPFVKEDNIKELKTKPKQAFSNLDQEEPPLIAKDSFKGLQAEPQDSKAPTFSSPAFDDAPAPPNAENISNILDNFQNIEGKSGFEPIASNVRNVFMASTPQSFAVEEEIVSEVIHSSNEALMSSPPPSSSGSESLDLLDNIKNFDKSSLSHPANFKDVALLPSKETIEDEKKLMAQEISKNKEVFSDVKEQILDVSPKDLKNVNTVVKESLPDKYDILSEKGHQEVLSELSEFDGLQQSKSPVTVDPQEFLRREIVNKEIEGFSVEHLAKTEPSQAEILPTMEDISNERKEIESDIQKSKNIYEGVMSEVSDFESSSLRPVDTEESSYMPDKIDLSVERALKGVMEEVKEGSPHLSHVEHTKEPLDPTALMAEEINRNNTLDSLLHFDKAALKHSEMEEKSVLPSEEDIKEERMRNDFTHDVEAFEKSSLNEKQHVELLSGIESFPRDELKVSEIKEPLSPSVLAKQELNRSSVLSDVESYDKGNLSHFIPVEKSSLPSASEIVEERQHIELLSGIESFDPSELKSGVKSKEPLSPLELAKQELTHKSLLEDVETYDKEKGLSHITTEVKNLLPTSADILLEREGDPKSRNMSGSSSGSLELKPGQMGGSSGVPLSAPLTMDDGRTSSSDEWVKLDQQSGGDLLG
ncbi:Retinol dehydrogenase 13like, partial [Caligus rogercresseyi]